jgi:hypothetical protein
MMRTSGGRTHLKPEEVLEIIREDATVSLGVAKDKEYLLFFSGADSQYKIALVAKDRSALVSILEPYFKLPSEISRLGRKKKERALDLYRSFIARKYSEA